MLNFKKTTWALLVTFAMTVVVTVLRVTLVPWLQSMDTGLFNLSYIVVAVMVVTLIAVFVLLRMGMYEMPTLPLVKGRWLLPIGIAVMAVGACILLTTVVDMYFWAALGVAPPPGKTVTGNVDRIALFLSMIFGALAGIYFIRLGLSWVREQREYRGLMPLWALAPAFWIWMRLARYEVSYASAVEVHESFYDFAMLLMSMLFLFMLARQMANVNAKRPYLTLFFAMGTVFLSVSGSLARVILFLLGEGDAYRAGQLAGVSDFAVGVLSVVLVLYWLLAPQVEEEFFSGGTITEEIEEADVELSAETIAEEIIALDERQDAE